MICAIYLQSLMHLFFQNIKHTRAYRKGFPCVCCLLQVSTDQQEAEKVKVVVAAEEQEIGVMQQRTQAIAQEAKADLAEAMPALQAAIDSLKALNKNDIVEVTCLLHRNGCKAQGWHFTTGFT